MYKQIYLRAFIFFLIIQLMAAFTFAEIPGKIRVFVNAYSFEVYVNGEKRGIAHINEPLTIDNLPSGLLLVKIVNNSYEEKKIVHAPSKGTLDIKFEIPTPKKEILLKEGDRFFYEKKYILPKNENAFERYNIVLFMDPDNNHAKTKIVEMLGILKTEGDKARKKRQFAIANIFYKQYSYIIEKTDNFMKDEMLKSDAIKVDKHLVQLREKLSGDKNTNTNKITVNNSEKLKSQYGFNGNPPQKTANSNYNIINELKEKSLILSEKNNNLKHLLEAESNLTLAKANNVNINDEIISALENIISDLNDIKNLWYDLKESDFEVEKHIHSVEDSIESMTVQLSHRKNLQ